MSDDRDTKGRFTKGNKAGLPFVPGNQHGTKHGKYQEAFDRLAYRYCLLNNATDEDLAKFFEVAVSTIAAWKVEHPSFRDSIIAGKEGADMQVAQATHMRATGGTVYEQQAIKVKDRTADGKVIERVEIVEVARYVPPDVQAQRMWLMNRNRNWRPENDQPDAKPPQVVNNTTINNTTVVVAQVRDELSEIFGDALERPADDAQRIN